MRYQIGDIVLVAEVLDRKGERPKNRPVVILDLNEAYFGAAITTQFGQLLECNEILVFDGKMGNRSGLKKASVVNCDWLYVFEETQIVRKLGHVMPDQLRLIRTYLNGL